RHQLWGVGRRRPARDDRAPSPVGRKRPNFSWVWRARNPPRPVKKRGGRPQPSGGGKGGGAGRGPAGIFTDAYGGKVCRNARTGTARGTGGATARIIGVSGDPKSRAQVSGCKLAHGGLSHNDCSRLLHLRHDGGLSLRKEFL